MSQDPQNNPTPPNASQPLPPPPGYPPGYPLPPGYGQVPPGYPPQGYPMPPQGYPMPPQGYPMLPQGYPMPPQGYPMPPQGYPMPPQGYPMPPQGYPMPPQGYPMPQQGYPMPQPGYPAAGYATGPMVTPAPMQAPAAEAQISADAPTALISAVAMPVVAPSPVPAAVAPVVVSEAAEAAESEDGEPVDDLDNSDGSVYIVPGALEHEGERPRSSFKQMWEKVGGGSLTLSIMIHAGLFLVAGIIIFTSTVETKNVDFLPGGGTAQGAKASQDMQHKVQNKRRQTISKNAPIKRLVSASENASIVLPETPADMLDVPDVSSMMGGGSLGSGGFGKAGSGGGFGSGVGMGGAAGFVSLPPSMRSRCSTTERLEKLRQNGGNSECEAAVSRALEWFKTKQAPDGSWGSGSKAGMTGMALLCYLGRCETPESPFYGDNVMKGIMYLLELQKKNQYGYFTENPKVIGAAYEHGIATYALGEMYTLARLGSKSLPGMREAFEKGLKLVIDAQNENGSWGYYTSKHLETGKPQAQTDLSVTGWQYQALKAGKNTGLKLPGLHSAIDKATAYIETTQTKDGGFGAGDRDKHYNQWSLSGAGILGLQTLAKNKTRAVDNGIKFLHDFIAAEPLDWNKNCNLYCWYYYTQAFFQKGGDDWKFYNEQLLPQILNNQAPDGSWKPERANFDAASAGNKEGGVYKTALCTLQLEVYYRYLKVADRDDDSFFDK